MDVKAEVFFLVVKLLEDEGCSSAAELLKRFIDEKKLLPARINTVGVPFDNTYDNYDSLHSLSKPSLLVEYYQLLMKLFHDSNRCASHVKTLIGIQSKMKKAFRTKRIEFNIGMKEYNKSRKSLLNHLHQQSRLQFHILAHRTAIYCLEFDKRGDYVFTGSDDYTIKVWSIKGSGSTPTCTLRHTLRGHVAEIIELAISMDNHLLASIDSNCCLVVWCLKTAQPVVAVRGSRNNRVLSGLGFIGVPKTVCSTVPSISNSGEHPSGMLVVSSFGGYLHVIPYVHTVRCDRCNQHPADEFGHVEANRENRWICCTVQLLRATRFTTAPEGTPNVFWPSIACIDVSPGGLLVAAGCSDQRIRLYQFMNPLKPEPAGVLAAHEESVNSVAFSHCGLKLATGSSDGGSCWLWKFQAGQWRSMTLLFRKRVKCRPCLLVWSIHDQYLIASMKNGSVYIYFGHSGQLVTVIEGHEGAIHAVSPSPFDENILATGGVDGRFQIWNISNLRRFQQQKHDDDNYHGGCQKSTEKPLLFHYRFPPGELDIMQGLVWRFDDPPDDQPIWFGANATANNRRNPREQSTISSVDQTTDSANDNTNTSTTNNPYHGSSVRPLAGSRSSFTTRTATTTSTKMQRITACRVLPSTEGVGFLVVTKSGVMSLFSPSEEPTKNDFSSKCVYQSTNSHSTSSAVDEQFLHWELDTAEWREVVPDTNNNSFNDPSVLRIYEDTLKVLGSPPAHQSATSLSNGRTDSSQRNPENSITNNPLSTNRVLAPANNSSDRIVHYTPPPAVLYEIIHAPSGVPFHRLPPGYLTNLRGFPYPPKRQLQIPGRSHLVRPLDLLPSVTLDMETGEDIVVDDIQFCISIPMDYCPPHQVSRTQPIRGKNYLWCSPWLTNHTPLVEPLEAEELNSKITEQNQRYDEERNFFSAGGEPVVSFGDEFMDSKHSTEQIIIMQPERNCFRQSQVSSRRPSSSLLSSTKVEIASTSFHCQNEVINHDNNEKKGSEKSSVTTICSNHFVSGVNAVCESNTESIAGPSFLHTYLMKTREVESEDVNSRKLLRITTRSATLPSAKPDQITNSLLSPTDDQDDAEDEDDSSEESEWSAHIDVDIGWWSRQRRRRSRRQGGTNDITASSEIEQINDLELDNEETNADSIIFDDPGEASLSSNHTETNQSGSNIEGSVRRSLRQQRRLLLKRRLMREAKKAEARAARAEIEKKYSLARRSRRFLHLVSDDCSRVDEDSTSRDTCMLESSTRTQSTETTTAAQNATSSSRKERLKRRLIRSLDYAVMSVNTDIRTCSRLPLTRIPLDCYLSPDCEGHEEVIENHFLIPNINVSRWPGPYFDWLSTVHPSASPYLPQSGDSIVYLYRGHKDYLSKAWESGNLPLMESTDRQETSNSPELPWIVWPDIPQYLCCVVRKITYHIVRIAGSHSNASRSSLHFKKKTRKHSYTKCLRQSHQLINLRDLNSSCHKEQKLSSSSSSVKQDCPIPSTSFDSNYSSPSSLSLNSGDSFVRLITLELQIEQEQPYSSFSYKKLTDGDRDHHGKRPETIHVTYHDVDGILEFIFLRRIFDTALQRKWKPGDVFICPVGNSWWRGCVVKNLFDNDLSTLKPSTSSVDVKTFTYSLTTSYLVRWLDENESIGGTLKCDSYSLKNDNSLLRISNIGSISLDKLPENIDHLNAWDMYKWYPERGYVDDTPNDSSTDSEFTLFGGLTDGYVYISHEQLCLLYGTSKFWDATNQSVGYLSEIKRLVECILQIMQLDISEDFIKPVDLAAYPDYLFINAFPVDLNFILNRLLNGFYRQPASVKSDFEQLLENTERYNLPESSIVHNAQLVCQLGLYCIENNVTSSDVQKRYTFLNLPNPLPESSEKVNFVTATPSLSPRGDYQVVRSRVRTRTFCTDRRRKLASRCHSSNRRSEIRRRKSSRLTHSLSKHSTEKHLSGSNSSAYGYSYNFKRKMSLREKGPPKKHNNLSSPSASWVPGTLNLIQELCSHQRSFYFRSPINPVEYPDYHSIVEHPMDLSTIQKKLINSQSSSQSPTKYHVRSRIQQEYSFSDLLTDLELIVSNAKLYNTDPDTQVFDDTLWLENWVNEVMKTHLSTVIESPSLKSLSRPGVLSGRVKSPRFDKSAPSVNCKNLRKRSFPTKSMNTSGDKKVEVNSGIISPLSGGNIASSSLAQSTTVRTSSGRIVKPPPRSVQDMSFSVSDDYDQKSDCSRVEHKKSHHSTNRPASCSSKKTMHPVNKLYSKYAKRKRSVVKHSQSTKLSNTSSEELWNTSLRRSTRKRKIVPNFDQYYASSEGYEEYE